MSVAHLGVALGELKGKCLFCKLFAVMLLNQNNLAVQQALLF